MASDRPITRGVILNIDPQAVTDQDRVVLQHCCRCSEDCGPSAAGYEVCRKFWASADRDQEMCLDPIFTGSALKTKLSSDSSERDQKINNLTSQSSSTHSMEIPKSYIRTYPRRSPVPYSAG
jgi:hypothetical protein